MAHLGKTVGRSVPSHLRRIRKVLKAEGGSGEGSPARACVEENMKSPLDIGTLGQVDVLSGSTADLHTRTAYNSIQGHTITQH